MSPSTADGAAPNRASALVVAGRVAMLLVAALGLLSALALANGRERTEHGSIEQYLCPMHPEVVSRVPGECPICNMTLERMGHSGPGAALAAKSGTVDVVKRRVVTQLVRAPAWRTAEGEVSAILHKDDVEALAPAERALFYGTAGPGAATVVRRSLEPPSPWDDSTVRVRFRATSAATTREDTGWLELSPHPRELLLVPASAVLYASSGAYVLAAPPDGHTFTRRSVEIGRILDSGYAAELVGDRFGAIVVRAGLAEGEQIVVGDTFFLDAELRLQAARGNRAEVVR